VVMAGWTPDEVELYLKQSYNQIDLILPEELVKVESVLSFKDVKPDISIKEQYKFDQLEPQRNQFDNDTEYVGNEMDDFLDDDYSDDDAFSKPKAKKRQKIKAKLKPKGKKKLLTDGPEHKPAKTSNGKVKQEKNISEFDEKVDGTLVKDETEFICHLCGIHCPSKSSLTNHLQMNCGNVCEICKEILGNKTEVKQHMFLVHKKIKTSFHTNTELNFACSQCPKRYASMHTLNNHIKKAHNKEVSKVQCPDCGNLFSSTAALRKHSSLHKPPELPCPICGKLFHNQTYLMRHATSVHGDSEDKKFKCEVCGKGFTNKHALEGHHNWHYNLKPFQCRWCERNYQNQSNCNAHERKSHKLEYQATLTKGNRRIQVEGSKDKYIAIPQPEPQQS